MKRLNQSGQTLIVLLIFIMVAITITVAAAAVSIINLRGGSNVSSGQIAMANARSGAENALLRLERDSTYSGGSMTVDRGTATISISGTSTAKTIVSVGQASNFSREITVEVSIAGGSVSITSWQETT